MCDGFIILPRHGSLAKMGAENLAHHASQEKSKYLLPFHGMSLDISHEGQGVKVRN